MDYWADEELTQFKELWNTLAGSGGGSGCLEGWGVAGAVESRGSPLLHWNHDDINHGR